MPPNQVIRPRQRGLTREAAEALNLQADEDLGDESGEADDNIGDVTIGTPIFTETGDVIDDSDIEKTSRLRSQPPPPTIDKDASARPPSIDEWYDFFARIVLTIICDEYIDFAFRGIDEDLLSDHEVDRLQLKDDERKRMARPFAELSHKSKFMRKHGRAIVASGGAFDAIIALGAWTRRVNRIARRYRPKTTKGTIYDSTGQGTSQAANGQWTTGTDGGRVFDGTTIINPGT
jgi:hypothetical protein